MVCKWCQCWREIMQSQRMVGHTVKKGTTIWLPPYNRKKTWLVIKDSFYEHANNIFKDTNINIPIDGCPYLGSAIGIECFIKNHIMKKVSQWEDELCMLTRYARPYPQAAYAVLLYALFNERNYLSRTTSCFTDDFVSLEVWLREDVIAALTGQVPINDLKHHTLALTAHCGGLGIIKPNTLTRNYNRSSRITQPSEGWRRFWRDYFEYSWSKMGYF